MFLPFHRVSLENSRTLLIENPTVEDMGLYQCTAVNGQGSDMEYSHLYFAGKLPTRYNCITAELKYCLLSKSTLENVLMIF